MKKRLFAIILSLLTAALSAANCYAVTYTLDPFSFEVKSTEGEDSQETTQKEKINGNWMYDYETDKFTYIVQSKSNEFVYSNLYTEDFTNDQVKLSCTQNTEISVYKDGERYFEGKSVICDEPGSYYVKLKDSEDNIMSFTIVDSITSAPGRITIPSVYKFVSVKHEDKNIPLNNQSSYTFEEEGFYSVVLKNQYSKKEKTIEFTVDNTAPVLEIFGLDENEAWNAVTFGELEEKSEIYITCNNKEAVYDMQKGLTQSGDYYVEYTDYAGNKSVYEFKIHRYLDIKAWVAVACLIGIVVVSVGYIIYKSKHLRVA